MDKNYVKHRRCWAPTDEVYGYPVYDDDSDGNDEVTVNPAVYSADYGYGSAAGTAGYGYGYVR
jgi:hypothetical protein